MKKTNKQMKFLLSLILCVVLIAATALFVIGCTDNNQAEKPQSPSEAVTVADGTSASTVADETSASTTAPEASDVIVKGEGATTFYFHVTDGEGQTTRFEIHTDKTIVGDALLNLGLITGENGPYGLYVKTVNGITADYDTDGTYWAFYIDDEYGMTGVDLTEITPGATYAFKVSK